MKHFTIIKNRNSECANQCKTSVKKGKKKVIAMEKSHYIGSGFVVYYVYSIDTWTQYESFAKSPKQGLCVFHLGENFIWN